MIGTSLSISEMKKVRNRENYIIIVTLISIDIDTGTHGRDRATLGKLGIANKHSAL